MFVGLLLCLFIFDRWDRCIDRYTWLLCVCWMECDGLFGFGANRTIHYFHSKKVAHTQLGYCKTRNTCFVPAKIGRYNRVGRSTCTFAWLHCVPGTVRALNEKIDPPSRIPVWLWYPRKESGIWDRIVVVDRNKKLSSRSTLSLSLHSLLSLFCRS